MINKKIFLCPVCTHRAILQDFSVQIEKIECPKWFSVSHKYSSRVCPHCNSKLKLKLSSISIILIALSFLFLLMDSLFCQSQFCKITGFIVALALIGYSASKVTLVAR